MCKNPIIICQNWHSVNKWPKWKMTGCRLIRWIFSWIIIHLANVQHQNQWWLHGSQIKPEYYIIWWKNHALGSTQYGVFKTSVKWEAKLKVWNRKKVCPHLISSYVKGLHFMNKVFKTMLFCSQTGKIVKAFQDWSLCFHMNTTSHVSFVLDQNSMDKIWR